MEVNEVDLEFNELLAVSCVKLLTSAPITMLEIGVSPYLVFLKKGMEYPGETEAVLLA